MFSLLSNLSLIPSSSACNQKDYSLELMCKIGGSINWNFVCSMCGAQFDMKREVGVHFTHMYAGVTTETEARIGYHIREHCSEIF